MKTVPFIVMVISGVCWLLLVTALRPVSGDNSPAYPEFWQWAVDACRIIFAASVLVILWSYMNKSVV